MIPNPQNPDYKPTILYVKGNGNAVRVLESIFICLQGSYNSDDLSENVYCRPIQVLVSSMSTEEERRRSCHTSHIIIPSTTKPHPDVKPMLYALNSLSLNMIIGLSTSGTGFAQNLGLSTSFNLDLETLNLTCAQSSIY